jgi:hypothetical protein
MSNTFRNLDDKYERYLFEYRYDNADWGTEIVARSAEEAKERLNSISWAQYKGEIKTTLALPPTNLLSRIKSWFF